MLNQIKALLSNAQLRQKIKQVTSMAEAIALIKTAGIEKGYQFSSGSISKLIESQLEPLSATELLSVAGGHFDESNKCPSIKGSCLRDCPV